MEITYYSIYRRLLHYYGPQGWWPAETDFEMMIGSILVQNTNWKNAEKALANLDSYLQPQDLHQLGEEELARLIRPSGYYNMKAKKIKAFLDWYQQYDYTVSCLMKKEKNELRKELLNIYGIGKETADVILLYVMEKSVFVADNYARRIFWRLGYDVPKPYDRFREMVEEDLPEDVPLFNEYHALLVEHGKRHCKTVPICQQCPLLDICEQRF
ncbi:endonuclease III domain-containing protein [Virgibacillus kimchii]